MKTLLMFDFSNLLFKSLHVHKNLTWGEKRTGGIYGFITQFCKYLDVYKPTNVIVCCDSRPYLRSELYPQYKEKREQSDETFYQVMTENKKYCKEFLDKLLVPMWKIQGYEADDLFAIACDRAHNDFEQLVVVSNDDDLFQLLKYPNVVLQRGKEVYTQEKFIQDYPEVTFDDWIKIVAMSGGHNNIPKLKGIGPKTALKVIREKRYEEMYNQNKELLDLCIKLVTLPFKNLPEGEQLPLVTTEYNERRILNFMNPLGITFQGYMRDSLERLNREI